MSSFKPNNPIVPLNIAVKFYPPTIAIFYLRNKNQNKKHMYRILLNDLVNYNDSYKITQKLFQEHSLYINENVIDFEQIQENVELLLEELRRQAGGEQNSPEQMYQQEGLDQEQYIEESLNQNDLNLEEQQYEEDLNHNNSNNNNLNSLDRDTENSDSQNFIPKGFQMKPITSANSLQSPVGNKGDLRKYQEENQQMYLDSQGDEDPFSNDPVEEEYDEYGGGYQPSQFAPNRKNQLLQQQQQEQEQFEFEQQQQLQLEQQQAGIGNKKKSKLGFLKNLSELRNGQQQLDDDQNDDPYMNNNEDDDNQQLQYNNNNQDQQQYYY